MGRFAVDTAQMAGASTRGAELSGQLTELRGRLHAAGSSAGAAGASDAVSAIDGCCTAWSGALGGLSDMVSSLGTNLAAAAQAYEVTDETAIGGR